MLDAAVIVLFLIPATVVAGAYALLTLLGWARPTTNDSRCAVPSLPRLSCAVLIPAHNEEGGIAVTIRSVRAADTGIPVYVVADNCTDGTAAAARAAGALVFDRFDGARRGKGHALAYGLEVVLEAKPDVVVILDADGHVSPGSLAALTRTLAAGADAAQARVRSANPDAGPAGLAAAVGCEIDAATAAGRERLGLSVPLRGTGMAFTRALLAKNAWAAFGPTEDAEYARTLAAAGVRVRYVPDAVVSSDAPSDAAILIRQRRRWRAALAPLTLRALASSKPLVLVHLMTAVAAASCTGSAALIGWVAGLILLTGAVYLRALAAIGITVGRCENLRRMPGLVLRLAGVTAAGAVAKPGVWDRTPRPGEPCRTAA